MAGSFVGVDLGGTRIKAGVVDSDGSVSSLEVEDVHGDGVAALEQAARLAHDLAESSSSDRVGICLPGLVSDEGVLVKLAGKHAGLEGQNVARILSETTGRPAIASNDAIAYAVGEATFGAGKGSSRSVVMTIGTGVGVTVVEGGRPLGGGMLGGGLLGGFIPISEREDGPADTSGRPDTIEAFVAARRLEEMPLAEYRRHLVRALVALAHAHAPETLIVGGGPLLESGEILDGLQEQVSARLYPGYSVILRRAVLGDGAALAGLRVLAGG